MGDVYIHWHQEMFDQMGMLREPVKWDYELRTPVQIAEVINRAMAVAMSEPCGPIFVSLPREIITQNAKVVQTFIDITINPSSPAPEPKAIRH